MARNKIVFGNEVLIDLTGDTVSPETLAKGATAHDKTGAIITGENTFDSDTSDATAAVAEILAGKTAYARGVKLEGTMPNNGAIERTIADKDTVVSIPAGFHDGSGTVSIDAIEKAKLIPGNVKAGVTVLGVLGEYGGEEIKAQTKDVTPSIDGFTVLPDEGFDYLSQVNVGKIPYAEAPNAAGGITVTIGG